MSSANSPPAPAEPAPSIKAPAHQPTCGDAIPYERFLDCVHCGLCTSACPTYLETGDENDSPRGRIYLMRAVTDRRIELTPPVARHLDLCLDCRSCETACPSGVQYGRLIEPFRVAMRQQSAQQSTQGSGNQPAATGGWFEKRILHGLFPYRNKLRFSLHARTLDAATVDRSTRRTDRPQPFAPAAASKNAAAPAATEVAACSPPGVSPGDRPASGTGRPVPWLCGRCDVPANALGYRPSLASERLRRRHSSITNLLRSDSLSQRQRSADCQLCASESAVS